MKSFKKHLKEQEHISTHDMTVINGFFNDEPNIIGDTIMTVKSEDGDFGPDDIRIDLVNGRARKGLALSKKGIISLAQAGKMIDRGNVTDVVQTYIRNRAKDNDLRVIG